MTARYTGRQDEMDVAVAGIGAPVLRRHILDACAHQPFDVPVVGQDFKVHPVVLAADVAGLTDHILAPDVGAR